MVDADVKQKLLAKESKPKLDRPRMYKVILINDDYTPMDFVVEVIHAFFGVGEETAAQIMWQVHTQGRGTCGVFTRDIAETKVVCVNDFSRHREHPLLCVMEPDEV